MNLRSCCMAVALCVSFLAVSVFAGVQTASKTEGAIVGTVADTSHAAVPGAKVTLAGAGVMGTKSVTTDENGVYRFPALAPGDYRITYELPGFSTQTREGIHISLGYTATVNVEMQLGGETQAITVTAETSAIDLHANKERTNV